MSEAVKTNEQNQGPNFAVQRIYIKASSFEGPNLPKIFKENLSPQIDMQIQTQYTEVEANTYEAVLSLDITNKAEEKVLWHIKLDQAGIFTLSGFTKDQLEPTLYGFCMNLLYPYACEAISNMAVKSGFVPVYLVPMNFEALYMEQKKRLAADSTAAKTNGIGAAAKAMEETVVA